jgi:DUF296 family protein family protein
METFPLRLNPGMDLRRALEEAVAGRKRSAAFVLSGIGSLGQARLRFAGVVDPHPISGDLELVTLAGTISDNGRAFTRSSPTPADRSWEDTLRMVASSEPRPKCCWRCCQSGTLPGNSIPLRVTTNWKYSARSCRRIRDV